MVSFNQQWKFLKFKLIFSDLLLITDHMSSQVDASFPEPGNLLTCILQMFLFSQHTWLMLCCFFVFFGSVVLQLSTGLTTTHWFKSGRSGVSRTQLGARWANCVRCSVFCEVCRRSGGCSSLCWSEGQSLEGVTHNFGVSRTSLLTNTSDWNPDFLTHHPYRFPFMLVLKHSCIPQVY